MNNLRQNQWALIAEDWDKLTPFQKLMFSVNEVWRGKEVRMCMEPGCEHVAGTPWTKHWCAQHDQERLAKVNFLSNNESLDEETI